jgi:hypothetical protein
MPPRLAGGQLDVRWDWRRCCRSRRPTAYILAISFMQNAGVHGVALQSGIWFVVTAIGIAVMDGSIVSWSRTQQVVGVAVAIALCWLISSTRATA